MVWKISKKKKETQKDIQQTALYGLVIIIGLSIAILGNTTLTIHRIRNEQRHSKNSQKPAGTHTNKWVLR